MSAVVNESLKEASALATRKALRKALDTKTPLLSLMKESGTVMIPALCQLPPEDFITEEHFQCATCGEVFAQDKDGAQFHATTMLRGGIALSLMAFFCNGSKTCKQALSVDLQAYLKSTTLVGTEAATVWADLPKTSMPKLSVRCCNACGKTTDLMRCGGCFSVRYCSSTCQRGDWSTHKQLCKMAQQLVSPEACEID